MVALVQTMKRRHVMMVHAQHGLIGPAGMIAVPIVMVELSQEAENVKMERKVIARGQRQMNNNAIDNHVNKQWFTGMIQIRTQVGGMFAINIFPGTEMKPCGTDVLHIVCHRHAALAYCWYKCIDLNMALTIPLDNA